MTLKTKKYLIYSLLMFSCAFANMPRGGFKPFVSKYFIETGTHTGSGITQALAAGFQIVRSIEFSDVFALQAKEKFKDFNNVHISQGDSGDILYNLIADLNEPVVFWLDGHNGVFDKNAQNTPILRELEQIKRHHVKKHTIIIDDMHCAGKHLFDFITQQSIIEKILEINPNYRIRYIPGGDDAEYPNNIMVAEVPAYCSPYLDPAILSKINKNDVNTILEIGGYDGSDSLALYEYYKCPIISFECAPTSIKKYRILTMHHQGIKLVEKAAWHTTEKIDFFYCPTYPSASSCFMFDYSLMAKRNRVDLEHMIREYPIQRVTVEATRLDEWLASNEYNSIDLLCMSPQGSIMPILQGLGSRLNSIKYIITQVMYERIYHDEAVFSEVNAFMNSYGFTSFNVSSTDFFNTVVFVKNELIKN